MEHQQLIITAQQVSMLELFLKNNVYEFLFRIC